MGKAKDCFEAGLFITGLLWSDRDTKPQEYDAVAEQARKSLSSLDINIEYVAKAAATAPTSTGNINDRLRSVLEGIIWIQEDLKSKIMEYYGDKGAYCFEVGMSISNLMFASGLLDKSLFDPLHHKNLQWLSHYIDNLRRSVIAIGSPDFVSEFVKEMQTSLADPTQIANLLQLQSKATATAQDLAVWIDVNIQVTFMISSPKSVVGVAVWRQLLITHFNTCELQDLCFDLKIDYDSLPGQGKADKVRELIAHMIRHGKTTDLLKTCQSLRPNVNWSEVM